MEKQQVYQQDFERIFSIYQKKRIAIYGTGQNARLIAECVSGYEIIGFISKDGTAGMLSEQVILSIDEAINIADIIIIAATVSSTNIIYSRIKEMVPPRIKVLDLYGEVLNGKELYRENAYWRKNINCLYSEVEPYEVISFDVFDTIIMRRVLKPEDIFTIVESKCDEGILKERFKKWRMEAEKTCTANNKIPSLDDIYELFGKKYYLEKEIINQLKQWEIEQEKKCIIARDRMVDIYHYLVSCGKKVYFTSDMYLSSDVIQELLKQCGIEDGYELLVSCELYASKQDGSLFRRLKEIARREKILHIGDHQVIDGVMAGKNGIDSFTILSSYDLLASSSCVHVFDCIHTQDDRNYLGYFASVMLNDPFALSKYTGKIFLSSYRDIALIIYPMTIMFLTYIIENAKRYNCIIFPSRDGFFLYQLYNQIRNNKKELGLPEAKYVYASRMALSRAAISNKKSFIVLIDKLFSDQTLNCKEYILNQFEIELSEEFDFSSGKLIEKWGRKGLIKKLSKYYLEITEKLEKHQSVYLKYLSDLGLNKQNSLAMVDIVSYGTQVYCLSQILHQEIDMIALGTTDVPNKYMTNKDQVFSVFGNINKKADGTIYSCSNFSVIHLLLEVLYASTDGQFTGFSENYSPIFQNQTKYNEDLVVGVQREIVNIMEELERIGFYSKNISREFSMGIIQLLFRKYSDIDEELKKQFIFSDPYMGGFKKVNLMDML